MGEPVQVHFTLRTNRACECKMDVKSTWFPTWHQWNMFHGHLDCFQKQPLGGTLNTKPRNQGTQNAYNHWVILFHHMWEPAWIDMYWNNVLLRARSHMTSHYTWESVTTHYMILVVSWDGLWTPYFGLLQFHGHGSSLGCKVALKCSFERTQTNNETRSLCK